MMLIGTLPTEQPKWTETRVELLTKLFSDGCSGSQIAAELGGVTRNAVIGKLHRLGLKRVRKLSEKPWIAAGVSDRTWYRRKHQQSSQWQGGASADKPAYRRNRSAPAHSFEAVTIGDEATDIAPEVIADPVTLLELSDHHCKWPVDRDGEPMMYCGAGTVLGFSYCARHWRMAHNRTGRHERSREEMARLVRRKQKLIKGMGAFTRNSPVFEI